MGAKMADANTPETDFKLFLLAAVGLESGLMDGLTLERIAGLFPAWRVKTFNDEEIHCECPDASHEAFVLLSGRVATTFRSGAVDHVIELGAGGDVFNAGGLVDHVDCCTGARALGAVEIIAIDTQLLNSLFASDPETGYRVVKNLAKLVMQQSERRISEHLELH